MTSLVTLITPLNLPEEKEKFLGSHTYNPIFHYAWQDHVIEEIEFKNPLKHVLFDAVTNQDNKAISSAATNLFEVKIEDETLRVASRIAQVKGEKSKGSAEEYARLTRAGLDYFGLTDVEVVLTDQAGFNARPKHKSKKILVSNHIQFEYFSMEGGVHHELVHTIRYYNGLHNKIEPSLNYLPTEEGLASWCQDNTNSDNGLAQHAMEYVATHIGLSGGTLRDIYECFRDFGASSELAWKRASRHKFGFVDTSEPGDIVKPAMYYANEIKIERLSTEEKLRLFVGKISLGELATYPDYTGHWNSDLIQTYFKL